MNPYFLFIVPMLITTIETCNILLSEPFTCNEILGVLKFHNDARNDIVLGKTKLIPAKNMWQLKWDRDLEEFAHNHAKQCVFQHSKDRPDIGENLALYSFPTDQKSIDNASFMKVWYSEYNNYIQGGSYGHYTQMIWADTKFIGCGSASYMDKDANPKLPYRAMFVCNYRPAGNVIGEQPYSQYTNGSKLCEDGVQSQVYKGLCAHDADHAKSGDKCPP